ncbi:RNA methyltransferase [Gillisia sp. M10.2A]|uniref:RNA methyltransferase n=1 Tax=Gillisia lutea TaxID=2909668 RepID=A0ABS9EHM6_9FLAO|nr:RNA methyltransferase [Gillisia lutea]MCF4102368.1 RNA methyltransferase [Gillisia lutea]
MVSKSQIKLITSLEQKKVRAKTGLFVVEGIKGISEVLDSKFELDSLFTTEDIFNSNKSRTSVINQAELKKISRLKTPQTAVALFKIPEEEKLEIENLVVALDGVRDPGNLGTIIRLCDWFGIKTLICSKDTVDCYNPKVVQATMGSITRVKIVYKDLSAVLEMQEKVPVMGAYLEGENIYTATLPEKGILIMGNEANGISTSVGKYVSQKINIPQYGDSNTTESLNVATATAILLGEFKRQENY